MRRRAGTGRQRGYRGGGGYRPLRRQSRILPRPLPVGAGWPRLLTTPSFFAYMRIADGCNNRCAYCAIPLIRGDLRSREMDALVREAEGWPHKVSGELVLVAQDTTMYGQDLAGRSLLPELLERLCAVDGLRWIRLLYCYPEHITDELLSVMRRQPKVLRYLDVPLQHCSSRVLRAMNRPGDPGEFDSAVRPNPGGAPGSGSAHHYPRRLSGRNGGGF